MSTGGFLIPKEFAKEILELATMSRFRRMALDDYIIWRLLNLLEKIYLRVHRMWWKIKYLIEDLMPRRPQIDPYKAMELSDSFLPFAKYLYEQTKKEKGGQNDGRKGRV